MISRIAVSAVILFGVFLAFAYKPSKKGLKRELGFLLLAAVGPALIFFPVLASFPKYSVWKALLASILFGPLFRYFFFGLVGTINMICLALRRLIRGSNTSPTGPK